MKVLFVAFEFPPLATSGVHRSLRFVRYLKEWGVTPIVLTCGDDPLEGIDGPRDFGLLGELPVDVIIERVPCPREAAAQGGFEAWKRIFFSVNDSLARRWLPELEKRLPAILEKHQPDAIYVSLPPFSMGPLWEGLSRRLGLPVVFDFRDLWSGWGSDPNPTWLHYKLKLRQENKCLRTASRVVCATEGVRRDLLEAHLRIAPEKVLTITNGYDASPGDWSLRSKRSDDGEAPYVFGYVGSFYYTPQSRAAMLRPWWRRPPHRMLQYFPRREDWLYRSPYFFFRAVAALLSRRPELRSRIRIRFAGRKPDWLDDQVREFGLQGVVEFLGQLDHARCLAFQSECDSLLMTSAKVVGGLDYCISSKTFEYFVTRKPILAFVTPGTQKDVLEHSGMALVCDPDATDEAARGIEELLEDRVQLHPNAAFLNTLHRRELTGELARVLLSLHGSRAQRL